MRPTTTLVTGAFGCIGSWVVRALLARGERAVAFDLGDDPWRMRMITSIDGHGTSRTTVEDVGQRLTLVRGDITDREALTRVVREHAVDRIIHLAAWQVSLCRQDPPKGALSGARSGFPTAARPTSSSPRTWRALIAAADSTLDGARVYNLHGEVVRIADVVDRIGRAWPEAKGLGPAPDVDRLGRWPDTSRCP